MNDKKELATYSGGETSWPGKDKYHTITPPSECSGAIHLTPEQKRQADNSGSLLFLKREVPKYMESLRDIARSQVASLSLRLEIESLILVLETGLDLNQQGEKE